MNTNLFGETDTPSQIYAFYQREKSVKDYALLLQEIDEIIKNYPNRAEVYALKGDILKKLDNYEEALENYTIAINKNPSNAAYYFIRAHEYLMFRKFYDAIDDFTYLLNHKELKNHSYYAPRNGGLRLIAACCAGDWEIAKEDIEYIDDDYVTYTQPVIGRITKERLQKCIDTKQKLEISKDAHS